ncbi:alpha/beta fold hydrolase [Pseudomonas sp. Pseusp122]|uniref:alpha/beta fold hydrolase n=1 Tax=unclassified Pseudomonas TaxID=196821 RepID=UPI0039A5DB54
MKKLFASLTFATSLFSAVGANAATAQPVIALVHGAFEDASIWGQTQKQLQVDGYKVITVDLPGRPSNPLAADKTSLDLYRDTVIKAIAKESQPVVLVGHSFGGIVISAVAEAEPARIKQLIYLAAYLPKDGQSLLQLAGTDPDSKMGQFVQVDKQRGVASIAHDARAELFANDGPDALKKAIPDLILDESVTPLGTPVHLTAAHFGAVKKAYIHTTQDHVISPALQASMVNNGHVEQQATLDSGHTPFLTHPVELAQAIEKIAR